MLGWFRPQCPLATAEKVWVESRMTWLAHQLGSRRLLEAEVVEPTEEFFPAAYGGSEAQVPQKEKKKCKHFTYIWDQNLYNPITSEVVNYIHFTFPDGSKIKRAFTYD